MTVSSSVPERITAEATDPDAWHCNCGNQPCDDGFYPCDASGREIQPDIGGDWINLYLCARCGRIINCDTLEVMGRKSAQSPIA
jgi:hypothetical protein